MRTLFILSLVLLQACASKPKTFSNNDRVINRVFSHLMKEEFEQADKELAKLSASGDKINYLVRDENGDPQETSFDIDSLKQFNNDVQKQRDLVTSTCSISTTKTSSIAEGQQQLQCLKKYLNTDMPLPKITDSSYHAGRFSSDLESFCSSGGLKSDDTCSPTGNGFHIDGEKKYRVKGLRDFQKLYIKKYMPVVEAQIAAAFEADKNATEHQTNETWRRYNESAEAIRDKICSNNDAISFAKAELEYQKRVGQASGFVDAGRMNQMGQMLVTSETYGKQLMSEFKKRSGGKSPDLNSCYSTKPKM